MDIRSRSTIGRLLIYLLALGFFTLFPTGLSISAATESRIQELHGFVDDGRGIVYVLKNLKKGDRLYAYMTNTSGNLDPLLGILKKGSDRDYLRQEVIKRVKKSDLSLIEASSRFADKHFEVWDDDSGDGHNAMLQFTIPADGTYFIFAGSMITSQYSHSFEPHLTSGSFRLLLGLNAPGVGKGRGQPTDGAFAAIDNKYVKPSSMVQLLDQKLTDDKRFTFHSLRKLQPGDSLYVRFVSTNGQPLPHLYLTDTGGKPLAFGEFAPSSNTITLSYHSLEGAAGLVLYIDGRNTDNIQTEVISHLVAGINTPDVLNGLNVASGPPVFKGSSQVKISLSVDQIVNVDQRSQNYTVVGSLELTWQDPGLAFSPDKCNCTVKKMGMDALRSLAVKENIVLPEFTFFNQQGNRWSQNEIVFIEPPGRATYKERFTVTLQAPDFNFQAYPFDRQKFKVRIDLNIPTEVFAFIEQQQSRYTIGEQLGEEEWTVFKYYYEINEIPLDRDFNKSRFILTMEAKRHLNFYLYRIFIPLFLIISVSWVIFFLKDYGRQLEVASGNLLVFVAFNFTISNDVPRLGYLTLLDRMIITSFCCAALVVFISVYQKHLETKGKIALAASIDKAVLIFYPLIYVVMLTLECFLVTRWI